ncbi:MAG: hypothetical protein QOH48_267 [Actinomycetota bacterium]|nr:hypothetical protein [Actinomycetota bacterium]
MLEGIGDGLGFNSPARGRPHSAWVSIGCRGCAAGCAARSGWGRYRAGLVAARRSDPRDHPSLAYPLAPDSYTGRCSPRGRLCSSDLRRGLRGPGSRRHPSRGPDPDDLLVAGAILWPRRMRAIRTLILVHIWSTTLLIMGGYSCLWMTPKMAVDQGEERLCAGQRIASRFLFFAKVRVASSNLVARSKKMQVRTT